MWWPVLTLSRICEHRREANACSGLHDMFFGATFRQYSNIFEGWDVWRYRVATLLKHIFIFHDPRVQNTTYLPQIVDARAP
jgi:hypothetical protein